MFLLRIYNFKPYITSSSGENDMKKYSKTGLYTGEFKIESR